MFVVFISEVHLFTSNILICKTQRCQIEKPFFSHWKSKFYCLFMCRTEFFLVMISEVKMPFLRTKMHHRSKYQRHRNNLKICVHLVLTTVNKSAQSDIWFTFHVFFWSYLVTPILTYSAFFFSQKTPFSIMKTLPKLISSRKPPYVMRNCMILCRSYILLSQNITQNIYH